jgi:hypothetical protein
MAMHYDPRDVLMRLQCGETVDINRNKFFDFTVHLHDNDIVLSLNVDICGERLSLRVRNDYKETRGRPRRYNFDELQVGDTMTITNKTTLDITGAITRARRRMPDRKFRSKTVDNDVRVWRVK